MDVVRKNVESLRGRVERGLGRAGTTFTLRLPLTMAITDAMLVRVGPERYLLPMVVIEQVPPAPRTITTVTGRGECVMLRNELIPIVRLTVSSASKAPAPIPMAPCWWPLRPKASAAR